MPHDTRDRVLQLIKALGDRTRFDIFRLIAAQETPICACDVGDQFPVSQSTIAHHMKVLHDAGLIVVSRQGVWAYYAVDPHGIETLQLALGSLSSPVGAFAAPG